MQFIYIIFAVAAALLLGLHLSQAYQGPWCAVNEIGGGTVLYNCSMRTLEMCVQEVIAGNRGFCNPNPYYRGPESPPLRSKRKRYYD